MPEAVFTLSADIVPEIDTREVENQAERLSRQLNSILSKQTDKIGLKADTGSFNTFKNKILDVSKATGVFQKALTVLPRTIDSVAKTGKSAFLKFTDAVNITRRDMVGFGGSILDTIRNTGRFVTAINDIKSAGSGLSDLPRGIEQIIAQVRSGTGVLDRAALAGDKFAQFLQPVAATGAASQKELANLNAAIQALISSVQLLATASGKVGGAVKAGFNIDPLEKAKIGLENIFKALPAGSEAARKFGEEKDKAFSANTIDAVTKALVDAKNEAQKTTGPLGRILQAMGKIDEADRKAAIGLEQGTIKQLNEIGRSDLLTRIEKINLSLRNIGERAVAAGKGLQSASQGFLAITHLEAPVGKLVASFDTLASGLVTKLRSGFQNAGAGIGSSTTALGQTIIQKLDAALAPLAGRVGKSLSQLGSFLETNLNTPIREGLITLKDETIRLATEISSGLSSGIGRGVGGLDSILSSAVTRLSGGLGRSLSQLGGFLQTNLTAPLKQGLGALGTETIRLGADIVNGLRTGITGSIGVLERALVSISTTVLGGLKRLFRIGSPSKETEDIGRDLDAGLASGIDKNKGLVTRALGGLVSAVKAPFKAISDVVSTTFRAALGKGPAEGIGAIGRAAGIALTPVKLFSQAVGPILQTGLQLTSAALKVAGVAFTGFLGAAVATGVQFNSLQAVVRSTLPVILGSADATNKLLGQINELNDTSPFARSAFLELTRVLAGFGIQAEKITPLIDAIQQAVAATGGGEQDLLDLGQAFARLQSQGRLSLDIIQSFSSRGIDVIAILGQEFNKTQGEIRDMISNGLIPAGQAIDALTKGLKSKFDGATDAVAKNLPGALDRVRAKTRDFGAELTRAFVSPTGGGAVIDLLNAFATVVDKITKSFLPLLRPALDAVAAAITNISGKAAAFAKTLGGFEAHKIKEFASGLSGLIGPLAALAGLLPGIAAVVPVIGPLLVKLFAGIPGTTIAIVAFLLTLKPVRDGLGEFAKAVAPLGETLLPKLSKTFKALGDAVGPIVGTILAALGPIVNAAGEAFGKLLDALTPILGSARELFNALTPAINIIRDLAVIILNDLGEAFKSAEPLIKAVVDRITSLLQSIKPLLDAVRFLIDTLGGLPTDKNIKINVDTGKAEKDTRSLVDKIRGALGGGSSEDKFKIPVDVTGSVAAAKDAANTLKDSIKDQLTAVDKVGDSFVDAYGKAKKASDDAAASVSGLKDQVKQQMSSFQGAIDPLIEAGKAVQAAHAAQSDAAKASTAADLAVTQVLKDQARALRDVISPTDELAAAQRGLIKTQNSLINLDRQETELKNQLKDLRGEESADKRAELDRGVERAKIALNKARQDEIDLLNKSNAAQTIAGNLEGLSLDQIKSRLSLVRLNLKAQKDVVKPSTLADEKTSAKLDTADAEQALKDATKARAQFELDTTNKIRDTEEQIAGIESDRADQRLEEQTQLTHINDLRAGETAQQTVIKDFEEKIKTARDNSAKAAKAVTDAVTASTVAELELKAKAAGVNGEYSAQFGFQQQINQLKQGGLEFDKKTEDSLSRQSATVVKIIQDLGKAQTDADKLAADTKKAAIAALGARSLQSDALVKQADSLALAGIVDPKVLVGLTELAKELNATLTNVSTSGSIVNARGESVILTDDQLKDILLSVSDQEALTGGSFRDILKEILRKIGLSIPGFAGGYAPGEVHGGMNDGMGLVRMFEYGKEAVLPLTRKFDMFRVVNNPSVLPGILEALPRWSMPDVGNAVNLPSIDDGYDAVNRLSSFRAQSGMAQSQDDRRKERNHLAKSVGEAVKTAVKEALSESGGLGNDVDINVHPVSGNEAVIAREVKRQVEKLLG